MYRLKQFANILLVFFYLVDHVTDLEKDALEFMGV